MGTILQRNPGISEFALLRGSGLRHTSYEAMLVTNNVLIVNNQSLTVQAGPVALTLAGNKVNYPQTLVADLSNIAATGTFQIRVRGLDMFGEYQEELSPVVAFTNIPDNFIYLGYVFSVVYEVAYVLTGGGGGVKLNLGTRFDLVRTEDANNHHIVAENWGLGIPRWLRYRPQGVPTGGATKSMDWNAYPQPPLQAFSTVTIAQATATGVFTQSVGSPANGEFLTIGGKVYTFRDTIGNADGDVKRSGVLATDLATLAKAINLNGIAGTDYGIDSVIDANVTAVSGATTLTVTAKVSGTAGNAITTTDNIGGTSSWGGATLSGGTQLANNDTVTIDGVVYTWKTTLTGAAFEVLISPTSATASADNLARAINNSGVAGTNYGTGTTAHPTVTATAASNVTTVSAKRPGEAGNLVTIAKSSSVISAVGPTLGTGRSAIGEIQGVVLYNISVNTAPPNNSFGEVFPQYIEIGNSAAGWGGSLEKLNLNAAAPSAPTVVSGNTVLVTVNMQTTDWTF